LNEQVLPSPSGLPQVPLLPQTSPNEHGVLPSHAAPAQPPQLMNPVQGFAKLTPHSPGKQNPRSSPQFLVPPQPSSRIPQSTSTTQPRLGMHSASRTARAAKGNHLLLVPQNPPPFAPLSKYT
jgi:hypothetical protein